MFTWEGYILDDKVNAPRHQDAWSWDGKPAKLEKVNDYTIKFTFPVAKPLDAFYLMNEDNFHVDAGAPAQGPASEVEREGPRRLQGLC
jgi:peptide/nickel transport system substrate-binding protein